MTSLKGSVVDSPLGQLSTDVDGSLVAAVRMNPEQAYVDVAGLLRSVINEDDGETWQTIKSKIDFIYNNLDHALGRLNEETDFSEKIRSEIKKGKKLLFKPNLVSPTCIDPETHGEALADTTCTPWPFIAALMRWFHDKLDITYHEMSVGEAASLTSVVAGFFSFSYNDNRPITTEAVIEGRSGSFYGGWGFYFARKYLAESHAESHNDDPMNGYEESVNGTYVPPGRASDKLMVYDLNRLYDDMSKAREVVVPNGANFKEITLHKAIIGGDPSNPEDIKDYPGCVLINVPRLKIHALDLLTNAIKNLGIGLYPMEVAANGGSDNTRWKYAFPFRQYPGMKTEIPHSVWVPEMDDKTGLPLKNEQGEYDVHKTAGISGTQADVIKATQNQNVFILHVVDAIEAINLNHTGTNAAVRVPEGYAFASLDPVALDLFCARYCFKTIPMREARGIAKQQGLSTDFVQRVPMPRSDGQNIVTEEGFDSPLPRYNLFNYAEKRGLGQQNYHVVGWDALESAPLASLEGHLGRIDGGRFVELITSTLYYNASKPLWDLQRTILSYLDANDSLTGSSYRQELLAAFDENGDGVIDYDEMGKRGFWGVMLRMMADAWSLQAIEKYGFLHGAFLAQSLAFKYSNQQWNSQGHDFVREFRLASVAGAAMSMSQLEAENQDPFFPTITWGKGKWPSLQFVSYFAVGAAVYGMQYPMGVDLMSLYGHAFQYADKTQNGGGYTGSLGPTSNQDAASTYIKAVSEGTAPLDFKLYVPEGYGNLAGVVVPNVDETQDANKMFTAHFNGSQEVW